MPITASNPSIHRACPRRLSNSTQFRKAANTGYNAPLVSLYFEEVSRAKGNSKCFFRELLPPQFLAFLPARRCHCEYRGSHVELYHAGSELPSTADEADGILSPAASSRL